MRRRARSGARASLCCVLGANGPPDVASAEELEQLADGAFLACRFGQRQVVLDLVPVATTVALFEHVPSLGEIGDHTERGALGDVERRRDLAETNTGIARDAQQHPRMVGEEVPRWHQGMVVIEQEERS